MILPYFVQKMTEIIYYCEHMFTSVDICQLSIICMHEFKYNIFKNRGQPWLGSDVF